MLLEASYLAFDLRKHAWTLTGPQPDWPIALPVSFEIYTTLTLMAGSVIVEARASWS